MAVSRSRRDPHEKRRFFVLSAAAAPMMACSAPSRLATVGTLTERMTRFEYSGWRRWVYDSSAVIDSNRALKNR